MTSISSRECRRNQRQEVAHSLDKNIPEYNVVDPLLFKKVSPTVPNPNLQTHASSRNLMSGPNH